MNHCDPLFFPLHVTETLGRPNPVTEEALITFELERALSHEPGTTYRYWNVGFLVLGEIIEMLSGMPYEEYVQTEVLHPLGIYDMHIGQSLYEDKRVREAEYHGVGESGYPATETGPSCQCSTVVGTTRQAPQPAVDRDRSGHAQAAHRRRRHSRRSPTS